MLFAPPVFELLYAVFTIPPTMALVLPEPVNATFFAVYATDISIADVVLQSITAEVEATFIVLLTPSVLLKLRYWPLLTGVYTALAASLFASATQL